MTRKIDMYMYIRYRRWGEGRRGTGEYCACFCIYFIALLIPVLCYADTASASGFSHGTLHRQNRCEAALHCSMSIMAASTP